MHITLEDQTNLSSLAFSLNWDPTVACYDSLDFDFDLNLGLSNFNLNEVNDGKLGFSWFSAFGSGLNPGDTLFAIQLIACGDPGASTPVAMSNDPVEVGATGPFIIGGPAPEDVEVLPEAGEQVGALSIATPPVPTLLLASNDQKCLQPGETTWMCITVDSVTDFSSLQFSLGWDPTTIEYTNLDFNQDLSPLDSLNFNIDMVGSGILGFSWFNAGGSGLNPGDTLFCLEFTLVGPPGSNGVLAIGDNPLEPAATGPFDPPVFPPLAVEPTVGGALGTLFSDAPPTALCKDVTIELPFNGVTAVDPNLLDDGSSDDCQLDTLFTVPDTLTLNEVGMQVIALIAVDSAGNTDTCLSNVQVEEPTITAPMAMCKDITVALDSSGQVIVPADSVNNGTLFSGTLELFLMPDTFNCNDLGDNTVELRAVDDVGSDTCTAIVTVEDNIVPTAVCQNDTIYLNTAGTVTLDPAELDGGSYDNCGLNIIPSQSEFTCDDVGTQTISVQFADATGNADTCMADVTVIDTLPPAAVCQDVTVFLDGSGTATFDPALADGGSVDNCELQFAVTPSNLACINIGPQLYLLTVTDPSGNTDTCSGEVTVVDTIAPTAVCQNATVYIGADGTGVLAAADINANSSDNCGFTLDVDVDTFTCADLGVQQTVLLTISDVSGNTDTCSAQITVADSLAPMMVCQTDTVTINPNGFAVLNPADLDGGSADNCSTTITFSVEPDTLTCDEVGSQLIVLSGTDESGNTGTCEATVIVQDTTPPTAICENAQIYLDATGTATLPVEEIDEGSSDNCNFTLSLSQSVFTCDEVGNTPVTLFVTDDFGNVDSCSGIVIVEDTLAPQMVCQDITVQLDAAGMASANASDIVDSSSDNCPLNFNPASIPFTCAELGVKQIFITGTDPAGNTDTCMVNVTVEDTLTPIANCRDVTVQLNAGGTVQVLPGQVDDGSTDNCNLDIELQPNIFSTNNIGPNPVVLTVTDPSVNSDTCNATVTVVPFGSGPVAVCQDITVNLTANGNVTVSPAAVNGGSTGTPPLFFFLSPTNTFGCNDIGDNPVQLEVLDNNGTDTCDAIITVEDNLPPAITCVNGSVTLDENGMASADIDDFLTAVSDNCGLDTSFMEPLDFSCADVGTANATIIAIDEGGNADTCMVEVAVLDNITPSLSCDSITVSLDGSGSFQLDPQSLIDSVGDNCDSLIYSLDRSMFSCEDVGLQEVMLTVTDQGGNSALCATQVTVQDDSIPVAVCQDINLSLGADGTAAVLPASIDDGSTDNCPITLSVAPSQFTCNELGIQPVILTVTDASGNSDQCAANVDVIDDTPPAVACQNITVQLGATGEAMIMPAQIDDGSTDNCTITNLELDTTQFTEDDLGPNTVTLTVTDQSGNSSTCTSIVTVVSFNNPPMAVCQDVTLSLGSDGTVILTSDLLDDGSTGAGMLSFEVTPNVFNCDDIGLDSALLIVTDENALSDTCQSVVTIMDDSAPQTNCADLTISLDDQGMASIAVGDVDDGSTDNCNIASLTLDTTAFECDDLGANIVTLTAVDDSGNSSNCTATITVEDEIDPVVTCNNITRNLHPGGIGSLTIPIGQLATASDNCPNLNLSAAQLTFTCDDLGDNSVLVEATDAAGNTSSCLTNVTIIDQPLNNPACTNVTLQLDAAGQGDIVPDDVLSSVPQGVCNPINVSLSNSSFDCTDLGINNITVTLTNGVGYFFSCNAQVSVVDQEAPTAMCQDITVDLDVNGNASITAQDVNNGSFDNCVIDELSVSPNTFNCGDAGSTVPVTLTVTDESNNTAQCTANVFVEGGNVINAQCKDATVSLDANGMAIVTPQMVDNGSTVGCGSLNLSVSPNSFDCGDIGDQTVVLTVSNGFGTSETCTATVTVVDDTPPFLTCANLTLELDDNGNVSILPQDAVDPFNTFDNCGDVIPLEVSPSNFDCSNAGTPVPYALSATDGNGNEANCAGTVTVIPNPGLQLNLSFDVTPESGPGQGDGTAQVSVVGGSGAYGFLWSTGSTASFITNLSTGEYCVTVTDLNSDCQEVGCVDVPVIAVTNLGIAGDARTEIGQPIKDVNVRLFGPPNDSTLTPSDGTFAFVNLPSGNDWEVSPLKDINDKNGVTTFDLVLISQHILQVFLLDSPYKMIAADANADDKISTLDILDLRLLILQIVDELPNNTSWRFLDAAYKFPNPDSPFIEPFPETIEYTNLTQSVTDADFIGVKIGDVDLSADPQTLIGNGGSQTRGEAIHFRTQDQDLHAGEIVEVPVRAADFNDLLGYQFTIDFNPGYLELQEVTPGDFEGVQAEHFGYRYLEQGMITTNWFSPLPTGLEDNTELFTLRFRVLRSDDKSLSEVLRFSSGRLSSEAYVAGEPLPRNLQLRFEQSETTASRFHLYQPRPNPFRDYTLLGFELPEAQSVSLRCLDASGRVVHEAQIDAQKGYNEYLIHQQDLPEAGIYFYQLRSRDGTASGRIIRMQ